MARTVFNRKSVDPATADRLGAELMAELNSATPNEPRIKTLINDGANLEYRDTKSNMTPLIFAASHGHLSASELLMDAGADVHAKGTDGVTAYHYAVMTKGKDLVDIFIDRQVDPNKDFYRTLTPMMWAANMKQRDMARDIAERGGGDILLKSQGSFPKDSIEFAEDNNAKALADDLRRIQKRKENELALKRQREKELEAQKAEHLRVRKLGMDIARKVLNHRAVIAPEKATFKKLQQPDKAKLKNLVPDGKPK